MILGLEEFKKIASNRLEDLDSSTREAVRKAIGDEVYEKARLAPMQNLPEATQEAIIAELGRRALTVIYRQLLLGVISELWVDYLTQMEALRVSIGLEAYAQRDPLVQYKSRASALFQELIQNMRLGVISRMFTYRPRQISVVQTPERDAVPPDQEPVPQVAEGKEKEAPITTTDQKKTAPQKSDSGSKKKRRRHR
jgi:preprotein translocase subunit SecA